MKKLMFILLNMTILLTLTVKVNGQHAKYFSKPSIYDIDALENAIKIAYDAKWLNDFYVILEKSTNDSRYTEIMVNNKYGKGLKSLLEDDNLTFIINGWLYVFSYEPKTYDSHHMPSRIDEDYNMAKTADQRSVHLYRKNVKSDNSDWEDACSNNELATDAIAYGPNVKAYSFNPIREANQGGTNYVIKSSAYKNVIFVLYGVASVYNSHCTQINQFVILTPAHEYNDGKIDYDFAEYLGVDKYPQKFTGVTDDGKTLQTIDNFGKSCAIHIKSGKDSNGKSGHISYDGDYGFGGYTGR
jgi:hypothetical protein